MCHIYIERKILLYLLSLLLKSYVLELIHLLRTLK